MVVFDRVSLSNRAGYRSLHDLNFHLLPGSFHYVYGPSGMGKTSLLRLVLLETIPTQGHVIVFNRYTREVPKRDRYKIKRNIGSVAQGQTLLDHLSIFDNVALPLKVRGEKPEHYETDVLDLLNWVGLRDKIDALPSEISSGEQQRATLARAVITKPSLLVADEPTALVDRDTGLRLMKLLLELNRQGTTIVMATQKDDIVEAYPARCLHLNKGRMTVVDPKLNRPLGQSSTGAGLL